MGDETTGGRDEEIRCACGGTTALVDAQGGGLIAYQCDVCDKRFQVQDDWPDESLEPDD